MRANKFVRIGIIGLTIGTMFSLAAPAMAKDGDVIKRGSCSGAADWKLKLGTEDGGKIEVEFEVEHAKPGQQWTVKLADNGMKFFTGSKTANGFGKFEVRKLAANQPGSDTVKATATNTVTGQVCNAGATL